MLLPFRHLPEHAIQQTRIVVTLPPHIESEVNGFVIIGCTILHCLHYFYEAFVICNVRSFRKNSPLGN